MYEYNTCMYYLLVYYVCCSTFFEIRKNFVHSIVIRNPKKMILTNVYYAWLCGAV